MSFTEKAYEFIRRQPGSEVVAGRSGSGVATQVGRALGCTNERARVVLMELEDDGRIIIEPPKPETPRRGTRPIGRVSVPDVDHATLADARRRVADAVALLADTERLNADEPSAASACRRAEEMLALAARDLARLTNMLPLECQPAGWRDGGVVPLW